MLADPYLRVFNRMRDMLTHDFIGLPEIPFALMVGNSETNHLTELNVFNNSAFFDRTYFETLCKLKAHEINADFALVYMEAWTIIPMLIEGATAPQLQAAFEPYGTIERHPDAKQVLLISLECADGSHRTEVCPISEDRNLGDWIKIPGPDPEKTLYNVLEICREPKQLPYYQAVMERLEHPVPQTELH